jgi:hypothetical protein
LTGFWVLTPPPPHGKFFADTADDIFTGVCQLATELDPDDWIAELNPDKTITVRDLIDKGRDGVLEAELTKFGKRLGNKSLPTKAELLFKHVTIRQHKDNLPSSAEYFRASELKIADDLRNEIIHGGVLPHIPVSRALAITMFLHEAASTAIRSIGFAYPLSLDEDYWRELAATKNPGVVLTQPKPSQT